MQSDFTKIPAFNHYNLVDICSQIVNIWPGWFIDIHFFQKCVIYRSLIFPRRNWCVLEVRRQIVYGRCARRMRSRIEVGALKGIQMQKIYKIWNLPILHRFHALFISYNCNNIIELSQINFAEYNINMLSAHSSKYWCWWSVFEFPLYNCIVMQTVYIKSRSHRACNCNVTALRLILFETTLQLLWLLHLLFLYRYDRQPVNDNSNALEFVTRPLIG